MDAYIEVTNTAKPGQPQAWFARVVSTQDFYEGGPWSHSHQTAAHPTEQLARKAAIVWAKTNGYTIADFLGR